MKFSARAVAGGLLAASIVGTIVAVPSPTIRAAFDYQPLSMAQLQGIVTSATVKLVALGCDLSVRNGTAIAISNGRLLTNKHVVDGARQVDAIPDIGPYSAGVVAVERTTLDVATVGTTALALQAIPLATEDPVPGTQVVLAGYPGQAPLTIGPGRVVDYVAGSTVDQPVPVMRLDASAHPGMSGGPVLDGRGHLAGLLFGAQSPSGYALALPASALRDVLTRRDAFTGGGCS